MTTSSPVADVDVRHRPWCTHHHEPDDYVGHSCRRVWRDDDVEQVLFIEQQAGEEQPRIRFLGIVEASTPEELRAALMRLRTLTAELEEALHYLGAS